jgi:ABC-2 type transport system permease protein
MTLNRALARATSAHLRTYTRSPLNLVMLVVIPILFVRGFGASLSRFADMVDVSIPLRSGEALTALWAAVFLTALIGMYMVGSAREADRRLVLAGLSPANAALARLLSVAILALLPVAASTVVMFLETDPAQPIQAVAVLYAAALLYAGLGVLVGVLTPGQLEGSFVLMLVFMFDVFLGSPLFADAGPQSVLTPARAPSEVLIAAVQGSGHAGWHWPVLATYTLLVLVAATVFFRREATR